MREALSLGHEYIGTEHILLGLVCVEEDVGMRILRDFDAGPDRIRDELLRMLSTPGRPRARGPQIRPAQLTVACPTCATPIETISTDRPDTRFTVSAEGDRTCPGCGTRWTISYSVAWEARTD